MCYTNGVQTHRPMAPETHTRYRVQKLIRMGEWLERNAPALITAFDAIDDAHTDAIEDDQPDAMTVEIITFRQLQPLKSMMQIMAELRRDSWGVKRGTDVTLHHPFACEGKEYEVVIEAPKPILPVVTE